MGSETVPDGVTGAKRCSIRGVIVGLVRRFVRDPSRAYRQRARDTPRARASQRATAAAAARRSAATRRETRSSRNRSTKAVSRGQVGGAALTVYGRRLAAACSHAQATGMDGVAATDNLLDLGVDSSAALCIGARLAEVCQRELPPELVFTHPTPELIAEHLASLAHQRG